MASQEAANAALAALEVTSPSIRGSQLYFQYSTRTSVEAGAAQGQAGEHKGEAASEVAGPVLMLNIAQPMVPITLENLHQVFSLQTQWLLLPLLPISLPV
jgi:hypothetical protein